VVSVELSVEWSDTTGVSTDADVAGDRVAADTLDGVSIVDLATVSPEPVIEWPLQMHIQ